MLNRKLAEAEDELNDEKRRIESLVQENDQLAE
jgi:hypothetical protein